MKNTKIIKLLKTFSSAEIKKFRDFVKSPIFNKNKNVIKLNETLFKFHPVFDNELLSDKLLHAKLYGREKFDYFKFKNITSDLYNLGIEFLKYQPNVYTKFFTDYNLMVELRTRKLWNYHRKTVLSLEKKFAEIEVRDSIFLHNNYLLTMESHLSNVLEKPNSVTMIQNEFNSFYEFTILNMLKFYNLMMHISKENNISIDMKMLKDVINFIENNEVSSNPTIVTYKYLVLLAAKRKEEHYFFLKEHFINNFKALSYEDAYYANMYIVGYCTDRFNYDGDERFITECYDLLKNAYKMNRVTLGELLYPNFINYVKVFTRADDTELARNFISDYKEKLPAKLADNCLNFSEAFILHQEGKFGVALSLLSRVNFPWVLLKIQVKIMQVQLNYQLGYLEETRDIIENFRKMLTKEVSVSKDYKNSVLGFLKFTIRLITLHELTDKKKKSLEISRFKDELLACQPNHFGVRFWLEDRLKEIV